MALTSGLKGKMKIFLLWTMASIVLSVLCSCVTTKVKKTAFAKVEEERRETEESRMAAETKIQTDLDKAVAIEQEVVDKATFPVRAAKFLQRDSDFLKDLLGYPEGSGHTLEGFASLESSGLLRFWLKEPKDSVILRVSSKLELRNIVSANKYRVRIAHMPSSWDIVAFPYLKEGSKESQAYKYLLEYGSDVPNKLGVNKTYTVWEVEHNTTTNIIVAGANALLNLFLNGLDRSGNATPPNGWLVVNVEPIE